MISAIIKFKASFNRHLQSANGHLLLSAIKHALNSTEVSDNINVDENRKLFTLSCVVPDSFWSQFENNSFIESYSVNMNDIMSFRITFLYDDHYEQFKDIFAPGRMTIGGMGFSSIKIADVCRVDQNEWKQAPPINSVKFYFMSPVGFKNSGRQLVLPTPPAVFNSLMTKWSNAFGEELSEKYCKDINLNKIIVDSFDIRTAEFKMKDGITFKGCVGGITYSFRDMSNDEKRALSWLSKFAFFSGVGYKTTQGLGQVIAYSA